MSKRRMNVLQLELNRRTLEREAVGQTRDNGRRFSSYQKVLLGSHTSRMSHDDTHVRGPQFCCGLVHTNSQVIDNLSE